MIRTFSRKNHYKYKLVNKTRKQLDSKMESLFEAELRKHKMSKEADKENSPSQQRNSEGGKKVLEKKKDEYKEIEESEEYLEDSSDQQVGEEATEVPIESLSEKYKEVSEKDSEEQKVLEKESENHLEQAELEKSFEEDSDVASTSRELENLRLSLSNLNVESKELKKRKDIPEISQILDQFDVRAKIGEATFSEVYQCFDGKVLKVIPFEYLESHQILHEIRVTRQLNSLSYGEGVDTGFLKLFEYIFLI